MIQKVPKFRDLIFISDEREIHFNLCSKCWPFDRSHNLSYFIMNQVGD